MRILPMEITCASATQFTNARRFQSEPPPVHWQGLIGNTVGITTSFLFSKKAASCTRLIEWFFSYPLTEISKDIYAFPDYGLYHGEKLIFTRAQHGKATQVEAASVVFKRRHLDGEDGQTFRITTLKPAAELRQVALAAQPPKENGEFLKSDLVDLSTLEPTIKFDIRYATTNNFLSMVFYSQAKAFLQRPAAEALRRAHQNLKKYGYGLLIHDAYRPWYVTKMFREATPPEKHDFVADPRAARATIAAAPSILPVRFKDRPTGANGERLRRVSERLSELSRRIFIATLASRAAATAMEEQGFRVYEFGGGISITRLAEIPNWKSSLKR
jgi:hypothetical protein